MVRNNVGRNPRTRVEVLHKLTHDKAWPVKIGLLKNPNITAQGLHTLSEDEDRKVRREVAKHPITTATTLFRLAAEGGRIAETAMRHPNFDFNLYLKEFIDVGETMNE